MLVLICPGYYHALVHTFSSMIPDMIQYTPYNLICILLKGFSDSPCITGQVLGQTEEVYVGGRPDDYNDQRIVNVAKEVVRF